MDFVCIKEARKGFWLHARTASSRHSILHASNDFLIQVRRAQLTGNKKGCRKLRKPEVNLARNIPLISNVCSVTYPDIFPMNSTRRALLNKKFSGKFIYGNFLCFSFRLF